jgi:hypothetical protein
MDSILAQFFREHNQHAAWWYKMKIKPELPLESTNNVLLPPDEAPGEHCLSKFLGITMEELWNVLIACKLAKETKGNRGPMLDKNKISNFITGNALTNILELIMKDSEHILRIGVYSEKSSSSDYKPKDQWKSKTKPRRPIRAAQKKFRDEMNNFFNKNSPAESAPNTATGTSKPANKESSANSSQPSPPLAHQNLKEFLSKILAHPNIVDNDLFFRKDLSPEMLESMFLQTCKETCAKEIKKQKEKKQEAVSAAVQVNMFQATVDPNDYPTLVLKNIAITSDEEITPVLREIVKLAKVVKSDSVDILKVLHLNDSTTSLVEVPCSAKQSGFKKQLRRTMWVHRILEGVRRYKSKEVLVNNDDDEIAYTDDDAARWLITYLGECFPGEFVKSAQALHMPIHKGKMDAAYTAAMWSDAGVGVAAQRIVMKYFISFFGYKFTVPEASINKLAVHSVPPIVGRIEYMDRMLDYWYKDLVVLLTGQIANEHNKQPADFSYTSVDLVIGADHGQGSFRAGVKVIYRKADRSIAATAIYGLGEIECGKDTGDLLALAFTPKLNSALTRIIDYERDANGKLVSDGSLSIYKKAMEGDVASTFYAILDRTNRLSIHDTLVHTVPIRVFITGDLAFYATVAGKEGMDKAHCHWCKLKSAEWQEYAHARGMIWDLEEMKRVFNSLNDTNKTQNGVKRSMLIDCIEIERYIFPVLHVTLGLANRLLKDMIDYADVVVEDTPEVLKDARHAQIEAEHTHERIKKEITDWGTQNGPTLANMHLAQAHLDEQIEVDGELSQQEREQAILDVASLKEEIKTYRKEVLLLKKRKKELSGLNTEAKAVVAQVERDIGRYNKPIRRGIETILSKDWNIKRPSWHGGDILGNECRKLMSSARLILDQIKEFLLERLEENGGSARAKREVKKRCDIVAKALLLFDGLLSLLRTPHKDLTPWKILQARRYATKALEVWRILNLSVTPKCHGSEDHACDQLEFLWGLADFCEDWVEQLHQLGLKNNRRTKTIRDRERKYKLYTHWEQLNGDRNVQKIKKEVLGKRKRKLQNNRRGETAASRLTAKTADREAALEEDNSQWTGPNKLLSADEIIRLDGLDRIIID